MAIRFFKCPVCGNVAVKVVDKNIPLVCCGRKMELLVPGVEDASAEKHVPVATRTGDCTLVVKVGSAPHPMLPEHHIDFICVETTDGYIIAHPGERPEATFAVSAGKAVALWEYCNIHGLWKATISE